MGLAGKAKFRNNWSGWIGIITLSARGDEKAIGLEPGEEIWLSEEEQQLTAEAPRDSKDNPFIERVDQVFNPDTSKWETVTSPARLVPVEDASEGGGSRRPIPGVQSPDSSAEEHGDVQAPAQGSYAPGEEVGSPEAQTA